jgi:hypothetical protein
MCLFPFLSFLFLLSISVNPPFFSSLPLYVPYRSILCLLSVGGRYTLLYINLQYSYDGILVCG